MAIGYAWFGSFTLQCVVFPVYLTIFVEFTGCAFVYAGLFDTRLTEQGPLALCAELSGPTVYMGR